MSHCVSVGVSALPAPTPFSCSYLIKSSLRQWRDPPSRESESTLYGSTRNLLVVVIDLRQARSDVVLHLTVVRHLFAGVHGAPCLAAEGALRDQPLFCTTGVQLFQLFPVRRDDFSLCRHRVLMWQAENTGFIPLAMKNVSCVRTVTPHEIIIDMIVSLRLARLF